MPLPEIGDTPGASRHRWRDVYRKDILPKLVAFDPDIILVSAGFDAHKKDVINYGYIGLLEEDYEWVTQQLVQVANRCCEGRLVSVLEGGYRIQGGIVSAFGRSVAGHVRALVDGCESRQEWSAADAEWESNFERRLLQERERKRKQRLEQQLQAMEAKKNQLRITMLQQQQQHSSRNNRSSRGKQGPTATPPPAPSIPRAPLSVATRRRQRRLPVGWGEMASRRSRKQGAATRVPCPARDEGPTWTTWLCRRSYRRKRLRARRPGQQQQRRQHPHFRPRTRNPEGKRRRGGEPS
ncbi:unnamed protein product, partial [Ectocarpus sp. 12 AP-2014]